MNDHDRNNLTAVLGARYGWDMDLIRGGSFKVGGLDLQMWADYVVEGAADDRSANAALDYLRLTEWLKFGNSVEQVYHAAHVAKRFGVARVVMPPSEIYREATVDGIHFRYGDGRSGKGLGVAGVFYYLNPLGFGPVDALVPEVRKSVRPLLSEELTASAPGPGVDDLVLHFRSSDVFQLPTVRHYGQPPLAFYLSAVAREAPRTVWLVFEDRANPCIDAAEGHLVAQGYKVIVQSGKLSEDLRVLLNARRLVIGTGTFGLSVAMLSTKLRRLYTFKAPAWDYLRLPDVEMLSASDADGRYTREILSENWLGSAEQRDLMLSYPADAVTFASAER